MGNPHSYLSIQTTECDVMLKAQYSEIKNHNSFYVLVTTWYVPNI